MPEYSLIYQPVTLSFTVAAASEEEACDKLVSFLKRAGEWAVEEYAGGVACFEIDHVPLAWEKEDQPYAPGNPADGDGLDD